MLAWGEARFSWYVLSYAFRSFITHGEHSTTLRKSGGLTNMRHATFSTAAMQSKKDLSRDFFDRPDEPSMVPLHDGEISLPPLTRAQISRASAQAVRQCTPADALYIVNSLHFSMYGHLKEEALRVLDEARRATRLPLQQHVKFTPIDFGQPVSPRLSAHCFLHMLLRRGHSYQAAKFARLMIQNGLRIRTFTMESVVKAVSTTKREGLLAHHHAWSRPPNKYPAQVLIFSQKLFSSPGHEAAFQILRLAREQGQRRSEAMYDTLISACLLQGEIIVAALLFACLVKDWQLRAAARRNKANTEDASRRQMADDEVVRQTALDERLSWVRKHISWDSIVHAPYPEVILLKKITHRIEDTFANDPRPDSDDPELQEALQALAILAALVEEGNIHFGKISPLLRALYNAPKGSTRVWKYRDKKPVSVRAYTYFHEVLLRLVQSLRNPSAMAVPPLDTRSCNSLLHYSLRHRFSPTLATYVMEYMFNERSFRPDIKTFNVLLRSGTTLRREDLSEVAVRIIRRLQGQDNSTTEVNLEPELVVDFTTHGVRGQALSDPRFTRALDRLRYQVLHIPATALNSSVPMKADEATVVGYIAHLTAIGQPYIIVKVLFDILPELASVDHPSWGDLPPEERELPGKRSRRECLKRAVMLGPRFFSVLLNALSKAGKTGLAERVWILAKHAERASWTEGFLPGVEPWYLPVAAYTSMVQSYANETRKGLPKQSLGKDGNIVWVPRSKNYVRGWARLIYRGQKTRQRERRYQTARAMANELLRAMMSGGSAVVRSLIHLEQALPNGYSSSAISVPRPDARFFNAALKLFRPTPWMFARRPRTHPARTRRFLRWAQNKFAVVGLKSTHWDPVLQEIAEAMIQIGYPLPPAFRHLFIGRYNLATEHFRPPITADRSPYLFPRPRHRFRPHALPTSKSRGLPIRHFRPKRHHGPTSSTQS